MEVVTFSLRGVGYSITSMLIVLVGTCVLRIVWIYCIFPFVHNLSFLFLMYPISWTVPLGVGIAFLVVLLRRDEKRDAAINNVAEKAEKRTSTAQQGAETAADALYSTML